MCRAWRRGGGRVLFEFISETETDRIAAYHVVLSHGYDAEATPRPAARCTRSLDEPALTPADDHDPAFAAAVLAKVPVA